MTANPETVDILGTWRLVRYADDFVVMVAGTRGNAETLRDDVAAVLAPMGLRLSEAKTAVVHINEGFDLMKRGESIRAVVGY